MYISILYININLSKGCIKVPKEHADKGDVYDFLTSYERHHVPYICKKVCTLLDKPHANYGNNRGKLLKLMIGVNLFEVI